MDSPTDNHQEPKQSQQGKEGRKPEVPDLSWRRDREELADGVRDLIAWRRQEHFPPESDEEMITGVLNLVEAIRMRNLRMYQDAVQRAVNRGSDPEKVGMDFLRAYLRRAARELTEMEQMQGEERRGPGRSGGES